METTFIAPEVEHLAHHFDRVVIVPAAREGRRVELANAVDVPLGLASRLATELRSPITLARAFASGGLVGELRRNPGRLASRPGLRRAVGVATRATVVRDWTRRYMISAGLVADQTVAYTYWWNALTLGLGALKGDAPGLAVVSRAHGADLYHERHDPPWIPGQAASMATVDRVFPDSDRGAEYLRRRYPRLGAKVVTSRLGVPSPGFRARPSAGDSFSVVSCSLLVPVKRVELIMRGVAAAAAARPETAFRWTHFGDGPLRASLLEEARDLPRNVAASFPGYPGLDAVMSFYRDQPVDVFVNASSSEGTPVAAMEALSCGIPLLLTDVGGNPELVPNQNGVLVDSNSAPRDFAAALLAMLEGPRERIGMADRSVEVWRTSYDADANYEGFAAMLAAIDDPVISSAGNRLDVP